MNRRWVKLWSYAKSLIFLVELVDITVTLGIHLEKDIHQEGRKFGAHFCYTHTKLFEMCFFASTT